MIVLMTLLERLNLFVQLSIVTIMSVLGIAFTYASEVLELWAPIEFPYNVITFVVWYPFYHFGFLFARSKELQSYIATISPMILLIAIGGFLVVSIIEALLTQYHNVLHAASQLKVSSKLTSLSLILLIFSVQAKAPQKDGVLAWIGRNSYFIYLFHLLPLTIAAKVISELLGPTSQVVVTPVKFGFALAASLISAWAARRLIPKKVQIYVLG